MQARRQQIFRRMKMTEKDKQKNIIKLCIDFICMFAAAVIAGCLVKEGVAAAASYFFNGGW